MIFMRYLVNFWYHFILKILRFYLKLNLINLLFLSIKFLNPTLLCLYIFLLSILIALCSHSTWNSKVIMTFKNNLIYFLYPPTDFLVLIDLYLGFHFLLIIIISILVGVVHLCSIKCKVNVNYYYLLIIVEVEVGVRLGVSLIMKVLTYSITYSVNF